MTENYTNGVTMSDLYYHVLQHKIITTGAFKCMQHFNVAAVCGGGANLSYYMLYCLVVYI